MADIHSKIKEIDPVWGKIRVEAEEAVQTEPLLGALFHKNVLQHDTIDMALAHRISLKLASNEMSEQYVREICDLAYRGDQNLASSARADIMAIFDRDFTS